MDRFDHVCIRSFYRATSSGSKQRRGEREDPVQGCPLSNCRIYRLLYVNQVDKTAGTNQAGCPFLHPCPLLLQLLHCYLLLPLQFGEERLGFIELPDRKEEL